MHKIFYIKLLRAWWNQISFAILDFANPDQTLDYQAPRVMQCQAEGTIYIATRLLKNPNAIRSGSSRFIVSCRRGGSST